MKYKVRVSSPDGEYVKDFFFETFKKANKWVSRFNFYIAVLEKIA